MCKLLASRDQVSLEGTHFQPELSLQSLTGFFVVVVLLLCFAQEKEVSCSSGWSGLTVQPSPALNLGRLSCLSS